MANKNFDLCFKILLIGDQYVGKTAIMQRFCEDMFSPVYISTLGLDFKSRTIEVDQKRIKLQIWDTAGQERFNTLTSAYYRGAQGIMLVYDVTNKQSFERIAHWMENIQKYAKSDVEIMMLANKVDLGHKRLVNTKEGEHLADLHNMPYYETSAKSNVNIERAFLELTEKTMHKTPDINVPASPSQKIVLQPSKSVDKKIKKSCC